MADKITWLLGADSSQVRTEMASAVRSGQQGAAGLEQSFNSVDSSHERLLRSSHRVAKQISNFSKDLLTGASAGDVFAASLEGIGRSLNLSLGALAGLAVGALVVQRVSAIREEYANLKNDLKNLHAEANQSGDFKTMSKLEEGAKRAEEAIKKLQDRIAGREGGAAGGIGQRLKDYITFGYGSAAAGRLDESRLGAAQGDLTKVQYAESDKMARRNQRSSGWEGKAQDIQTAHDEENSPVHLMTQSAIKLKQAFEDLAKTVNDKKMERAGMSLREMARLPDVVNNSVSYEKWKASQAAKGVLSTQSQGEAARLDFDPEGANTLFNQAGAAAEGITGLKPSEKMSTDFKGALAVTEEYLRQIADNKVVLVNK